MDEQELRTDEAAVDAELDRGDWTSKPAVAATGVAVKNTSGRVMWVEVGANGATMTNVKVDGVIIGPGSAPRTSGMFRVRRDSTIALTYSAGSPQWQWFFE